MSQYELIVLFNGYSSSGEGGLVANCTCTLLKGEAHNIIIDTRTPWDGEALKAALYQQNLTPDDIDYVICTHAHTDHIGCNYLFKNALHIVGKNCISKHDIYMEHDFKESYVIDEFVSIIATPGHTSDCITVMAVTGQGLVAIAGDLFEREEDLEDEGMWKSLSDFPELQKESRRKILESADYIVPGHGPMFKNPRRSEGSQ